MYVVHSFFTVTTQCVVSELEGLGPHLSGAMYVAKRFQLRNCGHHKDPQPATDCVQSMISMCLNSVLWVYIEHDQYVSQ